MAHALRSRDLYGLSPEALRAALEAFMAQPPRSAAVEREAIRLQVADFERRYEMTSEQLYGRLERDEIPETDDIADWLFLLQYLERLNGRKETPA